MRWLCGAVFGLWLMLGAAVPAAAQALTVEVDLSEQIMQVRAPSGEVMVWPVSTARPGKVTPTGTFQPQTLKRMHYSTLYNNAPMPFSIFFYGNYAIHGTNQVDRLGTTASAGCVRLHPAHAETLFNLVLQVGKADTRIVIRR